MFSGIKALLLDIREQNLKVQNWFRVLSVIFMIFITLKIFINQNMPFSFFLMLC